MPIVQLSIVLITLNEAANLPRTLGSLAPLLAAGRKGIALEIEIMVVDSGSTDRTVEIAQSFGAKVFVDPWQGFAAQKNFAMGKATGEWILSLDADEAVSPAMAAAILHLLGPAATAFRECNGVWFPRKNYFMGRWVRHGGLYPDRKLRLIRRGAGQFEDRLVHEDLRVSGVTRFAEDIVMAENGAPSGEPPALEHYAYPTISAYIEHMNRYSSLGAQMRIAAGRPATLLDLTIRPLATFFYNYVFRLGFLDGREGFYQHVGHAVYVWWKYAKIWEQQ